jgi:hypothetical protein
MSRPGSNGDMTGAPVHNSLGLSSRSGQHVRFADAHVDSNTDICLDVPPQRIRSRGHYGGIKRLPGNELYSHNERVQMPVADDFDEVLRG